MKVMRLRESDLGPLLIEDTLPTPRPGPGELLIKVHAAGITPSELIWYPTTHRKDGETRSKAIPAHEFSGVVAALGEGTTGFAVGQEVYGLNDWFAEGALAEFCITSPGSIAPKPAGLTHIEAATVPIGALTAWQGLFDRARLKTGQRILVHGGAGSVGLFAVQLARRHGAHVTATASRGDLDFVSELGAERVIDYKAEAFEESVHDVDVVFDTVGGETLRRSWSVLRPTGQMVTIAADSERPAEDRVKQAFFIVEPNQSELVEIGKLLDSRQLKAFVKAVLPLSEANVAFSSTQFAGRGKVVVANVSE
jgi:NADPH:quinone reductase-like Zn-dependent oxidoreductase